MTGTGIFILLALGILLGKVSDEEEVAAFHSLDSLGDYPASENQFASDEEKDTVLHGIYYKFRDVLSNKHVLFVGIAEGAQVVADIRRAAEWSLAMSGRKFFRIFIVPAVEFKEPEDGAADDSLVAVQCAGQVGYLPVGNVHALSPAELEMLGCDVKELSKRYDLLIICRDQPLRVRELFFQQMVEFCDGSFLYFGAGRTSRRLLRFTAALARSSKRTVAVVLTGVKRFVPNGAR